jgi:hypothetical protein
MMRPQHLLSALALSAALAAQSASDPVRFLVAADPGSGGTTQSATHRLTGSFSTGVPAARALSAGFVLLGGFPAAVDAPPTGRPWLTGVLPQFATLRGGAALALHGTELNLGAPPALTIGGRPAVLLARSNDRLTTTLPEQPEPGWRAVEASSSLGTTTLPRGIGVLPMLDFPDAPAPGAGSLLELRARQGDTVAFLAALGRFPTLPLPPFHHGLQLDLGTLFVLPPFPVTDPQGRLTLATPANHGPARIFVQAVVLSTDPGYVPGSFTNVVEF